MANEAGALVNPLHPFAWWLWAAALAAAAIRTTNPAVLLLILAVCGFVVASNRTDAPWAQSFSVFLRLGLFVLLFRLALQVVFGVRLPGHVVVTLPALELPDWAAGVVVGGPVTVESIVLALYDGLRLAVILACFGAANALASPSQLLRSLPPILYETGVVVSVALSFAPELVTHAGRLRDARRLRGRPATGIRSLRGLAVPLLEGALERSVELAASMDARGYGRRRPIPRTRSNVANLVLAGGSIVLVGGMYATLAGSASAALGVAMLVAGVVAVAVSAALRAGGSTRTRYRAQRWGAREWVVGASGAAALVAVLVVASAAPADLNPGVAPLVVPPVPAVAVAGVVVALVPAVAAPRPS